MYLVDLRFSWLLNHADYFNNQSINSLKNVGTQVSSWFNDTYNASVFVSILLTLVENISFIIFFIISIYISSIKFGILFTLFIMFSSLYFVYSNKKKLSSQLDLKTKKNYKINRKDNDVNKGVKFLFPIVSTMTGAAYRIENLK